MRLDFVRRIGAAAQSRVDESVVDQSFKSFPLDKLAPSTSSDATVAALDWFLDQAIHT